MLPLVEGTVSLYHRTEQLVLDDLVSAVMRLDLISGLQTALPLADLILKHAHQVHLPAPLSQVVMHHLEKHHPLALLVVLQENSHVEEVRMRQVDECHFLGHVHV